MSDHGQLEGTLLEVEPKSIHEACSYVLGLRQTMERVWLGLGRSAGEGVDETWPFRG